MNQDKNITLVIYFFLDFITLDLGAFMKTNFDTMEIYLVYNVIIQFITTYLISLRCTGFPVLMYT